jgi:hypothetical protein
MRGEEKTNKKRKRQRTLLIFVHNEGRERKSHME